MANQKTIEARLFNSKFREYKDVDLNFTPHPLTGDLQVLRDFEAVKNSVKNIILTQRLEKWFKPLFGSKVSGSLFEPLDSITLFSLRDTISFAINNQEPRVNLISLDIDDSPEESNAIVISIKFSLVNNPDRVADFRFLLERVR